MSWQDEEIEFIDLAAKGDTEHVAASPDLDAVTDIIDGDWRTSDYALVAYLSSLKFYHNDIDHVGPSIYWYYEDTPSLRSCINRFNTKQARVEPMDYAMAIRQTMRELDNYKISHRDEFPRRRN